MATAHSCRVEVDSILSHDNDIFHRITIESEDNMLYLLKRLKKHNYSLNQPISLVNGKHVATLNSLRHVNTAKVNLKPHKDLVERLGLPFDHPDYRTAAVIHTSKVIRLNRRQRDKMSPVSPKALF